MPVSLTGMLLFNAFENGKYGGGGQDPHCRQSEPRSGIQRRLAAADCARPEIQWARSAGRRQGQRVALHGFLRRAHQRRSTICCTSGSPRSILRGRTRPSRWGRTSRSFRRASRRRWRRWVFRRSPARATVGLAAAGPHGTAILRSAGHGLRAQAASMRLPNRTRALCRRHMRARSNEPARDMKGRLEFFRRTANRRFEIAPGIPFQHDAVAGTSVPSRIASLDWLVRPWRCSNFRARSFTARTSPGWARGRASISCHRTRSIPVHSQGEWGQIALFPAHGCRFTFMPANSTTAPPILRRTA